MYSRAAVWAAMVLGLVGAGGARAQGLERSAPEAQGVSSRGVREFVEAADAGVKSMHSFMLVRHGKVVAEGWWKPQAADVPHVLWSLSKSFTSTAVGLAIAEGKISLDDLVVKFFPDEVPAQPSDNLKAMRVRDLLIMSAGQADEVRLADVKGETWTKAFLEHPVPFKPGTRFLYNTPGTYMLSAIVQKATGQTVVEYLRPRLFEPLGIKNPVWDASPQGISEGGWGLHLKTEDIAKFGQLYLQKGKWNGRQLIPLAWVEAATKKETSNGSSPTSDWDQGYGYQFWRCRNNAFRGDGAFGQFCIVMPDQDAVVAITANTSDMQAELNLVWDKLLPAMQAKSLRADKAEQEHLKQTLTGLAVKDQPDTPKVVDSLVIPPAKPSPYEPEIQAFEAQDKKQFPPADAALFIGSSSFRRWTTMAQDFPEIPVINRGFGGSQISDSVGFVDRIVLPYKPRIIVMYAGTNDINGGKSPTQVRDDFRAFATKVRAGLPNVPIMYVAISPNWARWAQQDKVKEANRLIAEYMRTQPRMTFVNSYNVFLGPDGTPRKELYVEDKLHPNAEGYKVWLTAIKAPIEDEYRKAKP